MADQDDEWVYTEAGIVSLSALKARLAGRQTSMMSPSDILTVGFSRAEKGGWNRDKYLGSDTAEPVIVDEERRLIDGRHRLFKSIDLGAKTVPVLIATRRDFESSLMFSGNDESGGSDERGGKHKRK